MLRSFRYYREHGHGETERYLHTGKPEGDPGKYSGIYGDDGDCTDGIWKNYGDHQLFKGDWEFCAYIPPEHAGG